MLLVRLIRFLAVVLLLAGSTGEAANTPLVLSELAAYPERWEARGGKTSPTELFTLTHDSAGSYLRAVKRSETVRIFKKTVWDSAAYPVLEWKWRVTEWPNTENPQVALYVSLDTDIFGIPTILKYIWSRDQKEGTVIEGGFFRPMELVIRSGAPTDSWKTERIDVRADFERLVGRAPKGAAYGIGLLADPGVMVEVGDITAHPR